jgi:hypothetical protein
MPCADSCPVNPSLEQILTYDYCDKHFLINYSLILLLQATVLVHKIPAKIVACSTIYLWAFQIILCLIVGCVGVSVVWSAQLGILIHHRWHRFRGKSTLHEEVPLWSGILFYFSLVVGFTAWIYYAVTWEPITSLAHFCAVIMGFLLDALAQRWVPPSVRSTATEPPLSAAC